MWVVKNKLQDDSYLELFEYRTRSGESRSDVIYRTTERQEAVVFGHRGEARAVAKLCAAIDDEPGGEGWVVVRVKKRAT